MPTEDANYIVNALNNLGRSLENSTSRVSRNPVENPCFDTLIDGQAMARIRGAARV